MMRPRLCDLPVVRVAGGVDRGPPNSCSLNECRPGSPARARRCNSLLVTEARESASEQSDKDRQCQPRHSDRADPVSDVHIDGLPVWRAGVTTMAGGGLALSRHLSSMAGPWSWTRLWPDGGRALVVGKLDAVPKVAGGGAVGVGGWGAPIKGVGARQLGPRKRVSLA